MGTSQTITHHWAILETALDMQQHCDALQHELKSLLESQSVRDRAACGNAQRIAGCTAKTIQLIRLVW